MTAAGLLRGKVDADGPDLAFRSGSGYALRAKDIKEAPGLGAQGRAVARDRGLESWCLLQVGNGQGAQFPLLPRVFGEEGDRELK